MNKLAYLVPAFRQCGLPQEAYIFSSTARYSLEDTIPGRLTRVTVCNYRKLYQEQDSKRQTATKGHALALKDSCLKKLNRGQQRYLNLTLPFKKIALNL